MKRVVLQIISWLACAATILPALVYLADRITLEQLKQWMLLATALWFVFTPLWMGRKRA